MSSYDAVWIRRGRCRSRVAVMSDSATGKETDRVWKECKSVIRVEVKYLPPQIGYHLI